MLPSNMNLKIKTGTVRYNNKILVSDEKFSLEKNDEVNAPAMKCSKTNSLQGLAHAPNILHSQEPPGPHTITHNSHNDE